MDPLHKAVKTRFGIPNVHNKLLAMVQYLCYCYSIWIFCLYTFL